MRELNGYELASVSGGFSLGSLTAAQQMLVLNGLVGGGSYLVGNNVHGKEHTLSGFAGGVAAGLASGAIGNAVRNQAVGTLLSGYGSAYVGSSVESALHEAAENRMRQIDEY